MSADDQVEKFLDAANTEGTRNLYKIGLETFAEYYKPQGTIKDFRIRVVQDQRLDVDQKQFVARDTLQGFVKYLAERNLAKKSIRAYMSAVQSFMKFTEVAITLRWTKLPSALAESEKYPWTLKEIGEFVSSMDSPLLRALSSCVFQSGLSGGDALSLTYAKIKKEFENNTVPLCLDFQVKGREKTQRKFCTFLGSWSVVLLRKYLETVDDLRPETKLFPLTIRKIDSCYLQKAKAFLPDGWEGRNPRRLHTLRSAFRTLGSNAHVVEPSIIEFFMGHGSRSETEMERVYESNSRDGWRELYAKIEPFLDPSAT